MIQTSETKRTKKYPSFPLSNKETLAKVELITRLVETCIFAFPFLATKRTEEEDFVREEGTLEGWYESRLTSRAKATSMMVMGEAMRKQPF